MDNISLINIHVYLALENSWHLATLPLVSRLVKMISSGRRIQVSTRHWGPEPPPGRRWGGLGVWVPGPQWVTGAAPCWGSKGWRPREQNGFEVFVLAEIGSPENNANNPEYLFLNENHQSSFFYFWFHYFLRCHILVHVSSIFFC